MSFQIMLVHKKQARMIHIYAASYARIGFQFRPYLLHFFGGIYTTSMSSRAYIYKVFSSRHDTSLRLLGAER